MKKLEPHNQSACSSTLHARWPLLVSLIALLIAIAVSQLIHLWFGIILLLPAIVMISLSRICVTVNESGFYVHYGFIGWPRTSIPLHRISRIQIIDVKPKEWGGWGYRGSLTVLKQAAVVLRAGLGIRVDFQDGRIFVVTIDNPYTLVQILEAEISKQQEIYHNINPTVQNRKE